MFPVAIAPLISLHLKVSGALAVNIVQIPLSSKGEFFSSWHCGDAPVCFRSVIKYCANDYCAGCYVILYPVHTVVNKYVISRKKQ